MFWQAKWRRSSAFVEVNCYEGEQLTRGYKSLAYKIVFRASDRTLTDDEVNKCMDKIMNGLGEKNVVLRQ